MKRLLFILFLLATSIVSFAQTDSGVVEEAADTAKAKPVVKRPKPVRKKPVLDSTLARLLRDSLPTPDSVFTGDTSKVQVPVAPINQPQVPKEVKQGKLPIDSFYLKMLDNPFLRTKAKPVYLVISERKRISKDEMFYMLSGLLLILAFIKLIFSQYFSNIFRLFFQPSFRQKQTREQLAQNNLPSLMLNLFFILSAAAYISLLINYYNLVDLDFWQIFLYATSSLLVLYTGKYILLSLTGWVFDVTETSKTYIFIVYLINKIIGVILIPFILIVAFSQANIINGFITVSLLLVLILFLYRYLVSFTTIRTDIKLNAMHFLLYILAFEVTPLLLIYKTLSIYLNKST